MNSSADMLNYQHTVSYLRAVSFILAESRQYDLTCYALYNDEKLTKEAARIICDIIYWIVYKRKRTSFLQERLLWIKACSSIFGRSEAARLHCVEY